MKIDMHCHVLGKAADINNIDNDVYFNADDNNLWFTRILYNMIDHDLKGMGADLDGNGIISSDEYLNFLYKKLVESREIDAIVLLALDACFSPKSGELDAVKTDLWVGNRFLSKKVNELNEKLKMNEVPNKQFLFGASVNPNRKNWEWELDFVIHQTDAVLLKILPSAQHVKLRDSKHKDFYRTLAKSKIPMLCHVGPEYAFPEGIRQKALDNFRFLDAPLNEGVTVIAAHCATPVFPLVDRNEITEFYNFMKNANSDGKVRLWGDTSAFSLTSRLPFIHEILQTFPEKWLINGSDFPIPIDGWTQLPYFTTDLSPEEYLNIARTDNPFDRDVLIKRAHGFSDFILTNAAKTLRIQKQKELYV